MQLFCKVILDCLTLTVTWCIKCCIDVCTKLTVFHRKQKEYKRYSYITDAPYTTATDRCCACAIWPVDSLLAVNLTVENAIRCALDIQRQQGTYTRPAKASRSNLGRVVSEIGYVYADRYIYVYRQARHTLWLVLRHYLKAIELKKVCQTILLTITLCSFNRSIQMKLPRISFRIISANSARCNIYITRLCYDVSVRLSVRLSDGSALAHYSYFRF